jgi:hypothetical protein
VHPKIRARLGSALSLGRKHERGALDFAPELLERSAACLEGLNPSSDGFYPWGLDETGLWEPWARAREAVERLPGPLQEAGVRVDYLFHDAQARTVVLGRIGLEKPGCPRFAARECPRMVSMGHESPHSDCNYWMWDGMADAAPEVELFPEWQRFDCSRYYPLFQLHLCGEALAGLLGCIPSWVIHAPPESLKFLRGYAALTSRPDAFSLCPYPAGD